jgi:uncharacterized membrane protein YhaH (DUF805 family)
MDFMALYTSADGRISRKTWWIGAIILAVVNMIVTLLILPLLGLGMVNTAQLTGAAANDPQLVASIVTSAMQTSGWASLVVLIVFAWPIYCLSVKRRHDKNNNGYDVIGYLVLTAILLLIQGLGLGYTTMTVGETTVPTPSIIYMILGFITAVYAIYMLVVLGFLKGTPGTNQYGPDPLGGSTVAAAA